MNKENRIAILKASSNEQLLNYYEDYTKENPLEMSDERREIAVDIRNEILSRMAD